MYKVQHGQLIKAHLTTYVAHAPTISIHNVYFLLDLSQIGREAIPTVYMVHIHTNDCACVRACVYLLGTITTVRFFSRVTNGTISQPIRMSTW